MQYNVIVVFDCNRSHILMCRRRKNPYKGLINFVGGKIEKNEDHLEAAYRELSEETSISRDTIYLTHIIDFTYVLEDGFMEVYVGTLKNPIRISGTENDLLWVDVHADFSDTRRFAGCGNIYHVINYIKTYADQINSNEKVHIC